MAPEPLVPAFILRVVLDRLQAAGFERNAVVSASSVPPEMLAMTRLRVPWGAIADLLDAAERVSGDDRVGFHTAVRNAGEPLTAPELLFLSSGTVGEALRRVQPVSRVFGNPEEWTLHEEGVVSRYAIRAPWRPAFVHIAEHALAMPLAIVRLAVGARIAPLEVRFAHARDGDPAEYEQWFGCPVQFGGGVNQVRLSPELLALPLRTANPIFARHFQREAELQLEGLRSPRTLGERVRELLTADLDAARLGASTLEGTSTRLNVSARTLQRALD